MQARHLWLQRWVFECGKERLKFSGQEVLDLYSLLQASTSLIVRCLYDLVPLVVNFPLILTLHARAGSVGCKPGAVPNRSRCI